MKNVKSVQLDECDLIKVEDASIVVMVKVKEIDMISNMYHVCHNKGFDDIKIHHIGSAFPQKFNLSSIKRLKSISLIQRRPLMTLYNMLCKRKVYKTPPKEPKVDDSKPLGFEKGHIYNNYVVTSRAKNKDVSFYTDQVKDNHSVTLKDMATDEVISDNSKPPGFENFIKQNTNFEDNVKEKWFAISDLEQSKHLHTKLKDLKSHLKLWTTRINRMQEVEDAEKLESMDLIQKSRVKWEEPYIGVFLKKRFDAMGPRSPFLFSIVMEGLHMALNDGLSANMFHDVKSVPQREGKKRGCD
uniref:RNA-directed DNA polymerase, eukaryota n=1 Tax=Tanacetum cinerariifolium TaxID=118510 RepID=A0A699HR94_TANCI|nr:RNA-directed DNA polymerase, eukaryota [Tanacetum cinerariifolium]